MTIELTILAGVLVLALVYVFAAAGARVRESGLAYNAGARDEEGPPVGVVAGRLMRAQRNFYESLPLFIGAVLIAHVANVHSTLTVWGCWLFFGARVLYLPIYGLGIPYVRTLVFGVGMAGLVMILVAIFKAA